MSMIKPMENRQACSRSARYGGAETQHGEAEGGGERFVRIGAWAIAALIAIALLLAWLAPEIMRGRPEQEWREAFTEAEQARARDDRYRALEMYIHSARIASSIDDWRGQLQIACGLEKLGRTEGPSLYGFNVLVSAMGAAERRRSAEGMRAVSDAFESLGSSFASFARSRVRDDWPGAEPARQMVNQRTFAPGAKTPGC